MPLSLYFTDGKVKVELALARGKRAYDKRQDLAKRDADREIQRASAARPRGARGRCGDPVTRCATPTSRRFVAALGPARAWSTSTRTSCRSA